MDGIVDLPDDTGGNLVESFGKGDLRNKGRPRTECTFAALFAEAVEESAGEGVCGARGPAIFVAFIDAALKGADECLDEASEPEGSAVFITARGDALGKTEEVCGTEAEETASFVDAVAFSFDVGEE